MQFRKSFIIFSICTFLACGTAAQAGYIDNGDGTVTDTGTGLMWQQSRAPSTYTWELALNYCENLILNNDGQWTAGTGNASGAKHSDWRLPTAKELESIVDTTRYDPTINTLYFPPDPLSYSYWSSTTVSDNSSRTWALSFYDGFLYNSRKSNSLHVRAMRSEQPGAFDNVTLWPVPDSGQTKCYNATDNIICPESGQPFYGQDASYSINTPAYTKLAEGCIPLPDTAATWDMVRDDVTGLVWEEKHAMDDVENYSDPNDADNTYTWYDNNSETNGGNEGLPGDGTDTMDFIRAMNTAHYGGVSDWRMPTVKELQSIVDYGLSTPSINSTYFPKTVASDYWSSTTHVYTIDGRAWSVSSYWGYVYYNNKSEDDYVRAVSSGQCGAFSTSTTTTTGGATTTSVSSSSTTTSIGGVSTTTTSIGPSSTTTTTASPCPAKKVLGVNNPKLENLRDFRDSKLAQSFIGRKAIQIYYSNADSINAALERSLALRAVTRRVLEVLAPMVGK